VSTLIATKTPGEHFHKDKFGTIETGARADLVLLHANPLTDLEHLKNRAGVMFRGRWLAEAEIQRRLEDIAAKTA
jgi:imidazolonepropionase-like amidohydrolase